MKLTTIGLKHQAWPVATKFMSIGASSIKFPHQIVMTLDHDVQNKSEKVELRYYMVPKLSSRTFESTLI